MRGNGNDAIRGAVEGLARAGTHVSNAASSARDPSPTDRVPPLGEEIEESLADLNTGPLGGHDGRRRVSAGRRKGGISRAAQRRGPRSPVDQVSSADGGGGVRWGQQRRWGSESRKGLRRGSGGRGGVVAARRGKRACVGMSQGRRGGGAARPVRGFPREAPRFSGCRSASGPEGVPRPRSQHGYRLQPAPAGAISSSLIRRAGGSGSAMQSRKI